MPTTDELIAALEPLTSRVRTDVTAVENDNGMAWTREALTRVRLKRHVEGGTARGVCPIKEGESTTQVALFDLDNHKGATDWKGMVFVAGRLAEALEAKGYCPVVFRSSGGNGIHVFLVWDTPQDAYSVRQELDFGVLYPAGFKNGAKGVAHQQIEVFPKQDSVPEGGFGNQFILPLAGKSVPLEPAFDYEAMPRDYITQVEWKASAPVPVVTRPERQMPAPLDGGDHEQLRAALAAIPNDTDPLGYDEWREVVSAIHHETEGSAEGYALALDFSSRAPHFNEEELAYKVWEWLDRKGPAANPITGRTIMAKAREHGWRDEASPEDFPLVVTPQTSAGNPVDPIDLPLPSLQRDVHGKIEAVVRNIRAVLERPDICRMDIRFDEFKSEIVFARDGEPDRWQVFSDHHYFELRLTLETLGFKPLGRELVRDGVHYRARLNTIDTAIRWLGALVWDGVPRVEQFFARYFGAEDSAYTRAVSRYAWTALAGRVLVPGVKADMVPILTGAQGQRKSSGLEHMVPFDSFREMSFHQTEEARARLMRGCLVVELAELSGLKTRAIEEIKAWTARRKEDWVPKYQEYAVSMMRRCIFFGTSNPRDILDDDTGERRWLPLDAGTVRVEEIARDRDQLWAEGASLFAASGVAWREAERLAKAVHADYRVVDTWEQGLSSWLQTERLGGELPGDGPFRLRDAMVEGLGFSDRNIKRADEMRCAKALKSLGCERGFAHDADGKTYKVWICTTSHHPLA